MSPISVYLFFFSVHPYVSLLSVIKSICVFLFASRSQQNSVAPLTLSMVFQFMLQWEKMREKCWLVGRPKKCLLLFSTLLLFRCFGMFGFKGNSMLACWITLIVYVKRKMKLIIFIFRKSWQSWMHKFCCVGYRCLVEFFSTKFWKISEHCISRNHFNGFHLILRSLTIFERPSNK
jgi:hypothetical protein